MKKRHIITLVGVVSALMIAGFTACDNSEHTHSYHDSVVDPTCTQQGYTTYTCDCGDEYIDDYVQPLGHDYTTATTNPTCTQQGYTTYTCACGHSYDSDYVNAIGHSYTSYDYNDDATCTEDGTETAECDNGCGTPHTRTKENSKHGHSYTSYDYNDDATCTEDGTETASCDNGCGTPHTRTKENSKYGHSYTSYDSNGDATCTEDGTETAECDNGCGTPHTRTEENSKLEHDYKNCLEEEDFLKEAPTCKSAAVYYCSCDCGAVDADYTFEVEIYAPHNYVDGECTVCHTEGGMTYWLYEDTFGEYGGDFYVLMDVGTCMDTAIVIPDTYKGLPVKEINGGAFSRSEKITSVVIGDNVTYIGGSAFAQCTALTSVTIGRSVSVIESNAFTESPALTSFTIAADNETYCSIDGNIYSKDGKTLLHYAAGKTATSYAIPAGVTEIGPYAFSKALNLTSVTIGTEVAKISSNAFEYCSGLTEVFIPSNIKCIYSETFFKCTGLTRVVIESGATSIQQRAFSSCTSLTYVVMATSVKYIEQESFYGCNSLERIYYMGTEEDWAKVTIESYMNSVILNTPRYYYVENAADVPASGNYWHYVGGVPTAW